MKNEINIVGINGNLGSGKDTVADCFVENGYVKISLADPMKRFVRSVFGFSEDQLWGPSDSRNAEDPRYLDPIEWYRAEIVASYLADTFINDLLPYQYSKHNHAVEELKKWFRGFNSGATIEAISPRVCLQTLGTAWGRDTLYPDVWLDYMYREAQALQTNSNRYTREAGIFPGDLDTQCKPKGIVVSDVRFENELNFFYDNGLRIFRIERPETDGVAAEVGLPQHQSETEQQGFDPSLFTATIQNDSSLEDLLISANMLAKKI